MGSDFSNVYDDDERADSYADLEFPGTYWLAYRDIPALIEAHVQGTRALDFGCGACWPGPENETPTETIGRCRMASCPD